MAPYDATPVAVADPSPTGRTSLRPFSDRAGSNPPGGADLIFVCSLFTNNLHIKYGAWPNHGPQRLFYGRGWLPASMAGRRKKRDGDKTENQYRRSAWPRPAPRTPVSAPLIKVGPLAGGAVIQRTPSLSPLVFTIKIYLDLCRQ